ncbi:predicted protein [Sclerotinia sclerotiorum 1980 UF-70]|uniref:Uncharacterized protein n=1 Tax=Sclerotinia sclerotiorum (strain ATCC 18683 / 1980 / Ss-1) TaxID=665079 RepID=A7E650_SCLS1|nr:predicted protein [Sclerotinia sclerotiorum 1980 UF-70]EDN91372.1 predicted protein [Sclerotinia sclerotiorum 1980 UF-70]
MFSYLEALRHRSEKERQIRERLTQRRGQEWRHNTHRRRQDEDSIRFQIRYQQAKKSQIKRQVEIDYMAERRQLRRFREWGRAARKRKLQLVGFLDGEGDVESWRENIKEDEDDKWKREIQLCMKKLESRNRVEVKWDYLVMWGLSILSVRLAVFACFS